MLNDYILDDFDTFDDIDTSDVDIDDSEVGTSDFYDSFEVSENADFIGYDSFDSFTYSNDHLEVKNDDKVIVEDMHSHLTEHVPRSSQISFTGRNKCSKCNCQSFVGYGTYCGSLYCGHSWNSHNFWK